MITRNGNGNLLGDRTIPLWLAAHRTPTLNYWSLIATTMLIKPNKDSRHRAGRIPLGRHRRQAADHSRETAPATR